ncbi:Rv3654c family TadE-like protein [Phytoactinopolyspora halophila]|uniref:Helicase n=1 Tax=Phytoactinopolyspora halophila TaxID=1981511 RepID=A0A329QZJ4_9ACTN|nr:Rv3654c family TadE-like protein [Phytoactinopolyspora halophila]RAW17820.1 helicase [Phytoactinopolyspora halophila]
MSALGRILPGSGRYSRGYCRERGAGSILVLAAVGIVMVAFTVVAVLATGQSARRQAAAAADLAALAAAARMADGSTQACETARAVATANEATLVECLVYGVEVEVVVRVPVAGIGSRWLPDQDRRARAGPG